MFNIAKALEYLPLLEQLLKLLQQVVDTNKQVVASNERLANLQETQIASSGNTEETHA